MNSIDDIRKEIEVIDSMMASLLKQRLDILKKAGSEPLYSPARENYTLNRILPDSDNEYYHYYYKLANTLFDMTEQFQDQIGNRADPFLKENSDTSPFKDGAFALSHQATLDFQSNPEEVINATIGSLHDEDDKMVALKTVYNVYNQIPDERKASYADGITGNENFKKAIYDWINRNNDLNLYHEVVAAAGGTGALALGFNNFLASNDYILLPSIAWGSYNIMAKHYNLNVETYKLVNDAGKADLNDLMVKGIYVMKKRHKLVLLINDPCQNPTGITLSEEDWKNLVGYLNKMAEFGKVVLIVDLAYLDYTNGNGRKFLKYLNELKESVLTMLAFSCSKTLTAYGMRLGASVILSQNEQEVKTIANSFAKTARALWSNVNNAMMDCFVEVVTNHTEEFDIERQYYIDLLKQRADVFLEGASEYGLPMYPYQDGFFATLRLDDQTLVNKYHEYLLKKHIYTIKFNGGIRIALCSLNLRNCARLPQLLSQYLKECQNG